MRAVLQHVYQLGFRPRTVIDVGVGNGTQELYERFSGAQHLLVEPLAEFEPILQEICSRYDARYILAAAGPVPGRTVINVHQDSLEGSSLYRESEGIHVDGASREIPVITLDEACTDMKLSGPYLVKIDTQGSELDVLCGAQSVIKESEMIILETSLFSFFTGAPQFAQVVQYMNEHSFVVYDIFGGHNRPIDGALAQIDLAFVKENGRFRQIHHYMAQRRTNMPDRGAH